MNRLFPIVSAILTGLSGSVCVLTMSYTTYLTGHEFGYISQRVIVVGGLAVDCYLAEQTGEQVRALEGRDEGRRAPASTKTARGFSSESASRARRDVTTGTPGSPRLLPHGADPGTRKDVERWERHGNGQNEGTALSTHQTTVMPASDIQLRSAESPSRMPAVLMSSDALPLGHLIAHQAAAASPL
jgi:hypothetical protein